MKMAVFLLAAAVLVGGCGTKPQETSGEKASAAPTGPFAALQTEILTPRCAVQDGCHRGVSAAGGLNLSAGHSYESLVNVKSARRPERIRVVPGNPDASYLLERVGSGGDTPSMPMGGDPLSQADAERIRSWIKDGAPK